MSGKIKAKDLSYDNTLPPFLQRLKAQHVGRDGDPDRHERDIARPTRAKDPNDDDGPTVVDESGEVVSKEELEKLSKPEEAEGKGDDREDGTQGKLEADGPLAGEAGRRGEVKATTGLGAKKRKAAKVIGEEDEVPDGTLTAKPDQKKFTEVKSTTTKPKKKKVKTIKLAFDEGDEG